MKFVVKPDRPEQARRRRRRLWLLALALFLGGYWLGWAWHARQLEALNSRLASAIGRVALLERDNQRLQQDSIRHGQQRKIQQAALEDLRRQLVDRERQLQQASEELRFFHQLMDTSASETALAVHVLELEPTASERVYRYLLVLRQGLKSKHEARGEYWLQVLGTDGDRPDQLRIPRQGGLPFRFRYFQILRGQLELPAGFKPEAVTVYLQPETGQRNKKAADDGIMTREWPWRPKQR